jgi:hypothetical protein
LTNLARELAKLKDEIRATKPKAEPLARPTADAAVPPATASSAPAKSAPKTAPVKVSPPPTPAEQAKQFLPLVKKVKLRYDDGNKTDEMFDMSDGIIAHLTRECRGNVHNGDVVEATCGSFQKETIGANPYSGACDSKPYYAAKNAADLETNSYFMSLIA